MERETKPSSAPESIAYCPLCAAPMETRRVGDKPRRVCPSCDYIYFTDPKVGVGVLLLAEERILLVKRAMNPEAGKWSIPAGYLDYGEDPVLTAEREVFEETGLQVNVTGVADVFHNPDSAIHGGASVFILYHARWSGGSMRAGDDASAVGFFHPDELPELAFTSTLEIVARWKAGNLQIPEG